MYSGLARQALIFSTLSQTWMTARLGGAPSIVVTCAPPAAPPTARRRPPAALMMACAFGTRHAVEFRNGVSCRHNASGLPATADIARDVGRSGECQRPDGGLRLRLTYPPCVLRAL